MNWTFMNKRKTKKIDFRKIIRYIKNMKNQRTWKHMSFYDKCFGIGIGGLFLIWGFNILYFLNLDYMNTIKKQVMGLQLW